jgi:hypothetical protein
VPRLCEFYSGICLTTEEKAIPSTVNPLDMPGLSDLFVEIRSWWCEMQYPNNWSVTMFREILAEVPVADPLLLGGRRGSLL